MGLLLATSSKMEPDASKRALFSTLVAASEVMTALSSEAVSSMDELGVDDSAASWASDSGADSRRVKQSIAVIILFIGHLNAWDDCSKKAL